MIINIITWTKIRLQRAMGYMGIANTIMLILVLLKVENNLMLNEYKYYIAGSWFLLLLILGQIEILTKAPHIESEQMLDLQPPLKFMHDKIGETDERLIRIEKLLDERLRE